MKRVKTSLRCSLGEVCLENLLRIGEQGVPIEVFDATPFVAAWASEKVRRPCQKRKRKYKKKERKEKKDDSSSSESEFEGFSLSDIDEEIQNIL